MSCKDAHGQEEVDGGGGMEWKVPPNKTLATLDTEDTILRYA